VRCGFIHFPEIGSDDPEDKAWACKEEATHTCCDYGGVVCTDHKCRCSKPLVKPPNNSPTIWDRLHEALSSDS
jgi:hypothetical protein